MTASQRARLQDALLRLEDSEGCGCCALHEELAQAKKDLAEVAGLSVDEWGCIEKPS